MQLAGKVLPSRRVVVALLLLYALLVCSRMPGIITTGRFWAEEGTIFYVNAWHQSAFEAAFMSYGGYLNLAASASTAAARWLMPMALAPYMTIAVALFFQLIPPFIVLTARDSWLENPLIRVAAIGVLLFTLSSAEIWLQTLHCQIELGLACALIVCLDTVGGLVAFARLGTLFLAPLCGPGSAVLLLPLAVRLASDRTKQRLWQMLALGGGTAIQLIFFYHSQEGRTYHLPINVALAVVFAREPLEMFLGFSALARHLIEGFHHKFVVSPKGISSADFGAVLFFGGALLLSIRSRAAFWLLFCNAAFTGAAIFGSLGGAIDQIDVYGGERYIFVGQTLCGLMILVFAATLRGASRNLAWAATAWMLFVGIGDYWRPWIGYSGPSWRSEVAVWQADHHHIINIWPNGWTVVLP